jgi:hypothetical protein
MQIYRFNTIFYKFMKKQKLIAVKIVAILIFPGASVAQSILPPFWEYDGTGVRAGVERGSWSTVKSYSESVVNAYLERVIDSRLMVTGAPLHRSDEQETGHALN